MSSAPRPAAESSLRINWKAAAVMLALGLALGAVALGLALSRRGQSRRSATAEVERLVESGRDDLALRHINRYLTENPDDPALLQQQARLVTRRAETLDQMLGASRVYERLRQVAAGDPEMDEATLRELAAVYIKYSDALKATSAYRGIEELAAYESRYLAAEGIARRLVENHPDDAECHRLWAAALEGLAVPGAEAELAGAVREYARALELEPGHVEASERLARLYRDRLRDPAKAEAVLDRLIASNPDPIAPRLARYRYFRELARTDRTADGRAGAELDEALRRDPKDLLARLAAAEHALRNGRALEARDHVGELQGGDDADDFRVTIMKGLVEFAQEHPQEALEQWRQGLIQMQGTHAELTWWLAYVQLRLGHVEPAAPLIDQYRRLVESDEDYGLQFLQALSDERGGRPKRAVAVLERIRNRAPGRLREEIVVALGRCYEALGERELALRTYRVAERSAPGSALPRLAITSLLLEQGPDQAVAELNAAVADGEPAPDAELLVALAKAYVLQQASRPPAARSWSQLDPLLERLGGKGLPRSTLALLRADRATLAGRPDDAIQVLEEAVATDPNESPLWAGLATILGAAGRDDEALAALERGAQPKAAGDSATLRLTKARLLVAAGRGREAQAALDEGLERLPDDQRASLAEALGRLRAAQGDVAGARAAYQRWATLSPRTPQPRLALLQMALDRADRKDAEDHLGDMLKLAGGPTLGADDLSYRLGRALVLHRFAEVAAGSPKIADRRSAADDLKEAGNLVDGVIDAAPKLAPAYLLKGRILDLQGRPDAAVTAYRDAWERGDEGSLPKLLDAMARLDQFDQIESLAGPSDALRVGALSAGALLNAGESERAAKLLDQMVADPARTDAWRVRLLELAGRPDAVEAILRGRAERSPAEDSGPWMALIAAQVRHGRSAATVDRTIEEMMARARTERPDVLRAAALFAAARWAEAERAFEKVAAERAADPEALVQVSLYYEQTGRLERASATLERARQLAPDDRGAALRLAVQLASRPGDPAAAARAWELVGGDAEPTDPESRLARAVVLARNPDPARREQATAVLEALVADLDARTQVAMAARGYLARLLLATGHPERAVELAAVSAASGADAAGLALHAEALTAAGRFAEAQVELDRLLTLNPLDPAEPALRARLLADRAGAPAAPAALADAVERRGDSPSALALGRAAFDRLAGPGAAATPDEAALEAADRIAAVLAARDPSLGWMKAQVLAHRGRADEALAACKSAVDDADAAESDRYEACRVALAAAGQAPSALAVAAEVVDAALATRSDDPALLTMRALVHHGLAEYGREAETYRRVLEIWPVGRAETDQVQNNLAWVLSEGAGRAEEGLALAESLVARRGEVPQFLCTRGVALIRLGRADRAIDDLEKAVRADPTNGRRLLHLARAYRDAGRDEPFRAAVEQLRQVGLTPEQCDPTERDELRAVLGA